MSHVRLSRRHKAVLWTVAIICAATLATGIWLLLRATAQTEAHSVQAKKTELVQLQAARQILNHARVPYGWHWDLVP